MLVNKKYLVLFYCHLSLYDSVTYKGYMDSRRRLMYGACGKILCMVVLDLLIRIPTLRRTLYFQTAIWIPGPQLE